MVYTIGAIHMKKFHPICSLASQKQSHEAMTKNFTSHQIHSTHKSYTADMVPLHDSAPASLAALLDKSLDLLGTGTGGNHERIREIDNDQIVDTQASNQAAGARNNNTTKCLLGNDCW